MPRANQDALADLCSLIRARNTLIWITTREEARVESFISAAATKAEYEALFWDCADGLTEADGTSVDAALRSSPEIARRIREDKNRRVYVLRDIHTWLKDPVTLRLIRTAARELQSSPRDEARTMIVLSPSSEIPPELAGSALAMDWPLPGRPELSDLLDSIVKNLPENLKENALSDRDAAIDAAVGLTADEASACYAKSIVTRHTIDVAEVSAEKRRVIARERVLDWYDPEPRGLASVGGLDGLKHWLEQRRGALTQDARDFGLPAPKGVMLVGVPGCGKSLMAKAVASAWQIPLLRLDMGALRSKWMGESESNIRRALSVAETVAPCVLWLDEIEKSLAGSSSGDGDSGVSADALGAILSWMQERTASAFVVATANDVSALPPELLRKGRFDEMFFVDLPTPSERSAILRASLSAANRDPDSVDVARIAHATTDWSGAEIASLVPEGLFAAFNAKPRRELTTEDLVAASKLVVPMAKTSADKLSKLRSWAKGRCRRASIEEAVAARSGRTIDVE